MCVEVKKKRILFAKPDKELGSSDVVESEVWTISHSPICSKPYRAPLNKRQAIDKAVLPAEKVPKLHCGF